MMTLTSRVVSIIGSVIGKRELIRSDTEFYACATVIYRVTRVAYCVMASGRKRSPIWEYFVLAEDSRLAICQLCKDEAPRGGQSSKSYTATNLVHHLKTKHGQEYAEYEK